MLSAQARSCLVQSSPARSFLQGKRGSCRGWRLWGCSLAHCHGKAPFPLPLALSHNNCATPHWHWDTSAPSLMERIQSAQLPPWTELGRVCSNPWKILGILQAPKVAPAWPRGCEGTFVMHPPTGCSTQLKWGFIPSQIPSRL